MGSCLNFVNSMASRVGSGVYDYVPLLRTFVVWGVIVCSDTSVAPCRVRARVARLRLRARGRVRSSLTPHLCSVWLSVCRAVALAAASGRAQTAGLQLVTHALETDTHHTQ